MENAIENAAFNIRVKAEKNIQKKLENSPKSSGSVQKPQRTQSTNLLKTQLQEGKRSPLLLRVNTTLNMNVIFERRTGVAERNETERLLVKEALKYLQKNEQTTDNTFNEC